MYAELFRSGDVLNLTSMCLSTYLPLNFAIHNYDFTAYVFLSFFDVHSVFLLISKKTFLQKNF